MERYVLIDRIEELDPGRFVCATKRFDPHDPIFKEHFPGVPFIPGSLLLETMAQAGGWLIYASLEKTAFPVVSIYHNAKFRRPVPPGTQLRVEARVEAWGRSDYRLRTLASAGDLRAAQAVVSYSSMASKAEDLSHSQLKNLMDWAESTYQSLL